MARNYHLTGLEPASVWENFYAISQIPRETGNPEGITSYLLDFCKAHGIEAYRDEAYNVIARVPATPGYENASPVILHSHSDMVCIKDEGVDHDFAKDPSASMPRATWSRRRAPLWAVMTASAWLL